VEWVSAFSNSIAIAARYAQKKYGVDRVLIADWDVHHGNGTQDIFYSDGTVLFFSTHSIRGTPYRRAGGNRRGAWRRHDDELPISGRFRPRGNSGRFPGEALARRRKSEPGAGVDLRGFDSREGDPWAISC